MNYWLMKSEPDAYSIEDLKNQYPKTEPWDGIRNYQVRNMMRDQMRPGDLAFFYHSNCKPPGIVGIMEITKAAYPDHTAFDPDAKYYDPKSNPENPRWLMVDVKFVRRLNRMISLDELKRCPTLIDLPTIKKGNRLSIMPISKVYWNIILEME